MESLDTSMAILVHGFWYLREHHVEWNTQLLSNMLRCNTGRVGNNGISNKRSSVTHCRRLAQERQ